MTRNIYLQTQLDICLIQWRIQKGVHPPPPPRSRSQKQKNDQISIKICSRMRHLGPYRFQNFSGEYASFTSCGEHKFLKKGAPPSVNSWICHCSLRQNICDDGSTLTQRRRYCVCWVICVVLFTANIDTVLSI